MTSRVYDASGRTVAEAVNGTWICTRYDARDRVIEKSYPANPTAPARTITTNYAVGGDPQTTSVTDSAGTITTRVDLLGRTVLYTDVHGTRTEPGYDQAGRVTSEIVTPPNIADTPQTSEYRYDDAGRVLEVKLLATVAGTPTTTVLAMPGYDAAGELASVNYGSGTSLTAIGKDQAGRITSLNWRKPDATQVVSAVTRSRAGTITDESLAGVDARPTGPNYLYDAAGRLAEAWVTGHHYTYDFTTTPTGCPTGTQANAGANTNRLRLIDASGTGTTETGYCYDTADRILATTGANPVTGITYDDHGNTTQYAQGAVTTQLGWDSADRNLTARTTSTNPADVAQVSYGRDATDRIVRRDTTQGDTPAAVLYSYTAHGDTADLTLDASKRAVSRTISLPGGVVWTATLDAQGNATGRYDHPTVRGDLTLSTDAAGVQIGDLRTYTPYGEPLTAAGVVDPDAVPDNQTGQFDYGWLGQHQRPYEHAGALSLVQMGARPYSPLFGRFLSVDPVEGGSANDYDYTNANPINTTDLDGRCPPCAAAAAAAAAIPTSAFVAVGAIVVGAFGVAMVSRHSFAMPKIWTSNRRSLSFKGRSWGYRITYGNGKTWKYGITSARPHTARPESQLKICSRATRSVCKYRMYGPFPTKWQARMWEHARIMHYKRIHGVCPPGQRKSCR